MTATGNWMFWLHFEELSFYYYMKCAIFFVITAGLSLQASAKWDTLAVIWGDLGWNEWLGQMRATNLCGNLWAVCDETFKYPGKVWNCFLWNDSQCLFYCTSTKRNNSAPQRHTGAGWFFCTSTIVSQHRVLSPGRPPRKALRYVFFTGRPPPPPPRTRCHPHNHNQWKSIPFSFLRPWPVID